MPTYQGKMYYANQILCPACYRQYVANGRELQVTDMCVRCQDVMLQLGSSGLEPEDDTNAET